MGFGETSSHIIFFVASLIIAVGVVSIIGTNAFAIAQNFNERGKLLANEYRTAIAIINDPAAISNYIYVKNIGKTILHPELVDVFIDGSYIEPVSVVVENGGALWLPGDVINITVPSLPSGTHRIMVVTEYGVSDVITYVK
jgi:flagellar protein FlaG